MPKFTPADDGKTIEGKVVVFVYPPGADGEEGGKPKGAPAADSGLAEKRAKSNAKKSVAAAQAKALKAAAKNAVPFCEECEKAKKEMGEGAEHSAPQAAAPQAEAPADAEPQAGGDAAAADGTPPATGQPGAGAGAAAAGSKPAATAAAPKAQDDGKGTITLSGTIEGPGGPLGSWAFSLKKDGKPIDKGGLAGTSKNTFSGGAWLSQADGGYLFERMAKGTYEIEVMTHDGELEVDEAPPAVDSGVRDAAPASQDVTPDDSNFSYEHAEA